MTAWRLVWKEILHRKLGFTSALVSVVIAVGSLVGALTLLDVHDARTRQLLAEKEARLQERMDVLQDDVRKAMLKLGFNIVILPRGVDLGDWYTDDYSSRYMPQEYATRLAESSIVTVRHLLPILQQRIKWPEVKRTVILVGTRGEVPNLYKQSRKPMVQPVAAGTMVLGYELHQSLKLEQGDKAQLLGKEFTVAKSLEERGNRDDITVWINLAEAQDLLDKPELINAILALECVCATADVAMVREEIATILPDTQVIERGTRALARAEARRTVAEEAHASIEHEREARAGLKRQRRQLASILIPVIMIASAFWVGITALANVRERRKEIGILRALGFRTRKIMFIFLSKATLIGFLGGLLGLPAGFYVGRFLAAKLEHIALDAPGIGSFPDLRLLLLALLTAPLLALLASWLPALIAGQQDPAVVLREE